MRTKLAIASVLFTLGAFSGAVQAAPTMCVGGTANVPPVISTTDVTLGGSISDDCFYDDNPVGSDPTSEEGIVNGTTWATVPEFSSEAAPDNFTFAAKQDIGGGSISNTVLGIMWALEFVSTGSNPDTGTWTLSWEDPAPPETFPLNFDIVVLFKAGSGTTVGYLFDDFELISAPDSSSGSYVVNIVNNGGQLADLSHGSLFVRTGEDGGGDEPMPVPGTVALLGLGLAGLGWARRKARR